ncbi:MAG: hypothetical protein BJ554DRAFT_3461, partial [Olpidium bornovanus]
MGGARLPNPSPLSAPLQMTPSARDAGRREEYEEAAPLEQRSRPERERRNGAEKERRDGVECRDGGAERRNGAEK